MRRRQACLLGLTAAFAIGGCSSKAGSGGSGSTSGSNSTAAAAVTAQTPPGPPTEGSNVVLPVPHVSPTPLSSLPSSFRGRWGTTATACAGDDRQAITVAADTVSIEGTSQSLDRLTRTAPDTITVQGGETLVLLGDGRTLVRKAGAKAITYRRCP